MQVGNSYVRTWTQQQQKKQKTKQKFIKVNIELGFFIRVNYET